jgi:hypothetical protein
VAELDEAAPPEDMHERLGFIEHSEEDEWVAPSESGGFLFADGEDNAVPAVADVLDDGPANIGPTDSFNTVGPYRVTSSSEMDAFLAEMRDAPVRSADQRQPFNHLMQRNLISARMRMELAQYMAAHVGACRHCGTVPCRHFPSVQEASRQTDSFIKVPLLKKGDDVILYFYFVPLTRVYEMWLGDPVIGRSIITQVQDTGFTSGAYFKKALQHVEAGSIPLALALNSDGATVVNQGTRSMWAINVALLNSSCSRLDTARCVGFIPKLTDKELELSVIPGGRVRQLMYHSALYALTRTGGVCRGDAPTTVCNHLGEPIPIFPWIGLYVADSKDQDKAMGRKEGAKGASNCGRCWTVNLHVGLKPFELAKDRRPRIEQLLSIIDKRVHGTVAKAQQQLKDMGINAVRNFTWDLRLLTPPSTLACVVFIRAISCGQKSFSAMSDWG